MSLHPQASHNLTEVTKPIKCEHNGEKSGNKTGKNEIGQHDVPKKALYLLCAGGKPYEVTITLEPHVGGRAAKLMQSENYFQKQFRKLAAAVPHLGHVLPLVVVSAAFVGLALWIGQISGIDNRNLFGSWEFLAMTLSLGALVFSGVMSFHALRIQSAALADRALANKDVNQIRHELNLAQAMLKAEPQLLMLWDEKGEPNLIIHTLDTDTGIPFHFSETLYFDQWLEVASAIELRAKLEELFSEGNSFTMTIRTLTGHHLEADGRSAGGTPILRLRNIAGSASEIANIYEHRRRLSQTVDAQKALLNALPLPVWFRDEGGKITWVNSAYMDAVEVSDLDDVKSRQIELLEMRQRKEVAEKIEEGEIFSDRFHSIISGERRAFDAIAIPLNDGSAGLAMDVGAIETAEGKLESLIETHTRTLNRVATAIAIFDMKQRLTFYNQAYLELWSLDQSFLETTPSETEILDQLRSMRQLPEEADYRAWRERQLSIYQSQDNDEQWWHLPDGRTIQIMREQRSDGGVTHLYDDVTERFALESRFNELIGVQRETLDNLEEGVAVFATDGRLRLYNPAFAKIWQLEQNFLRGTPHIDEVIYQCRNIFDDASWSDVHSAVTSISDQRHMISAELTRQDGMIIQYSAAPLPDGATLLTYKDVTAHRRMERVLLERNEALVAADRLKNTFISHVSYELRSPLTNIIGFSELLANQSIGSLNDKQTEYLGDIQNSSDSLLAIVDDILDLASIDAGGLDLNIETIKIEDAVSIATAKIERAYEDDRIEFEINMPKNLPRIEADSKRIGQVLYNLLTNAIGFSDEGAKVTLKGQRDGDEIILSVRDEGCGIPEMEQKSVFERFESQSRGSSHRGAGLGLSIVKSLVELHNGTVNLASKEGEGTLVTVRLPIKQPQMDEKNENAATGSHAA